MKHQLWNIFYKDNRKLNSLSLSWNTVDLSWKNSISQKFSAFHNLFLVMSWTWKKSLPSLFYVWIVRFYVIAEYSLHRRQLLFWLRLNKSQPFTQSSTHLIISPRTNLFPGLSNFICPPVPTQFQTGSCGHSCGHAWWTVLGNGGRFSGSDPRQHSWWWLTGLGADYEPWKSAPLNLTPSMAASRHSARRAGMMQGMLR